MKDIFIHPTAEVAPGARIGIGTKIWHQAQIREGAEIGQNCVIGKGVYIDRDVKIGDGVKIQNGANLYRGLVVEDNVFIGPSVTFTNDLFPRAQGEWSPIPTIVEKGASVGANATILCGIRIGTGAMIGAGSVVTRDVPALAVVAGNPARLLRFIEGGENVEVGRMTGSQRAFGPGPHWAANGLTSEGAMDDKQENQVSFCPGEKEAIVGGCPKGRTSYSIRSFAGGIGIGLVGAGQMGQKHARVLANMGNGVRLVGIADVNRQKAEILARQFGVRSFQDPREMLPLVDALVLAVSTESHYQLARDFLESGIPVLVEKPLCSSLEEAVDLVEFSEKKGVLLAVGHVERFNPTVEKLGELLGQNPSAPLIIETRRYGPASKQKNPDLFLDLMIHDLDIATNLLGNDVLYCGAVKYEDRGFAFASAQVVFRENVIGIFSTSFGSQEKIRQITVLTPEKLYQLDLLTQVLHLYTQSSSYFRNASFNHEVSLKRIIFPYAEPLRLELEDFIKAVVSGQRPKVDGRQALSTLGLVEKLKASLSIENDLDHPQVAWPLNAPPASADKGGKRCKVWTQPGCHQREGEFLGGKGNGDSW